MPTIQQLIRKGRKTNKRKSTAPAMQSCPQKRGVCGAVMNVPILKFFGYPINKAIGSAAAIGFIIALFGAAGFLISGSYLNAQLPLSIGFLNMDLNRESLNRSRCVFLLQ